MIKRLLVSTVLAITSVLLIAFPVLAIAPPDSVAIIGDVNVYRDCLESDDQLYVIQYTITYAATPDEAIDEAYIFRLMDGATELKSATAYAYHTSGYGDNAATLDGIAAIYFSADEVTDKGMGWASAYTTVLAGNPTLSWTGSGCPYVTSGSFAAWNDPIGNTLGDDITALAQTLSTSWGGNALWTTEAGSTILSSYGNDYFGTSISNLMTMQPDIFSSSLVPAEFYERDNPLTYATSIDHTYWAGTWIDDAVLPTATALDIDLSFIYGGIWAAITIALLVLLAVKVKPEFEILLLLGGIMAVFGTLLRFVPMLVPVLIGVVLVILFVFKRFLSPSGA